MDGVVINSSHEAVLAKDCFMPKIKFFALTVGSRLNWDIALVAVVFSFGAIIAVTLHPLRVTFKSYLVCI